MTPSNLFFAVLISFSSLAIAQSDVAQCGLNCIADVSGTSCSQAQWTCLCQSQAYLQKLSGCTANSCNHQDCESTISIVAELCAVFNETVTINPYATATTGTENPLLSTVAIPSGSSLGPLGSPTSTASSASGTLVETTTTTRSDTTSATSSSGSSSMSSTAAATTTNIAQRADTKNAVYQGIAVALLGFAIYL